MPSKFPPPARNLLRAVAIAAALVGAMTCAAAQRGVDPQLEAHLKDKRWAEALALVERRLRDKPDDVELQMQAGALLATLNRSNEALAVFRRVAEKHPDQPAAHNNMAVILAASGRYDEAREALEKALRTHPAYSTAHENLGDLYTHLAGEAYKRALQFDTEGKTARPKLAMISELTALVSAAPAGSGLAADASAAKATAPAQVAQAGATPAQVAQSGATAPKPAPATAAPAAAAPAPSATPSPAPAAKPAPTPPSASRPEPEPAPKPAATPAQPPAAAASPAPTPPANAAAEVRSALQSWARAWSARDMKGYVAAYTPAFKGSQPTRAAWVAQRRSVIEPRRSIQVDLSDIAVAIDGDRAEASFRQSYQSDGRSIVSRKTISLRRVDGRWLISDEPGR
ncbi:MAG: tetratricopeptide repeat protein [Burkholderiales bacterium]|nr:tetratricopeptide repeat protein [Burkholderiales bacterium]